jgi:DNA-directed RNA polymerase subunit RPC12/RpoP
MATGMLKYLAYAASVFLIFLAIIFMMSWNLGITNFFVGLVFIGVAVSILFFSREKKPLEIKQTVTVTGPVATKEIRCPACNAVVDPTKVEIITGKPYLTCSYCKNKFELTEEPTW